MDANLDEKYYKLRKNLEGLGSALVAYSGGVDSTLLLFVAKEALGDDVLAATISSPLHPKALQDQAARMAARLKAEHITLETDEFDNEEFVSNPPERCYLCKHARFSKLIEIAAREGIAEVVDGTQLDDTGDYRPGFEAARELSVRSPLLDVGFYKYEVRALSRELGLSTWNMRAYSCLATRVPYGETITREKLSVIDEGERFLMDMGLSQVRLRYIEDRTARIEVGPESITKLVSDGIRERVLSRMKELGFIYVTLDLAGYRMGALNEAFQES
jgi:pyridinium-3,5-biscarboxylic acid mononucleotide sulfurtransferase